MVVDRKWMESLKKEKENNNNKKVTPQSTDRKKKSSKSKLTLHFTHSHISPFSITCLLETELDCSLFSFLYRASEGPISLSFPQPIMACHLVLVHDMQGHCSPYQNSWLVHDGTVGWELVVGDCTLVVIIGFLFFFLLFIFWKWNEYRKYV